ncbi:MAG TPA: hypothetical protein VFW20_09720 [Candidatus Limnocylindrales bacterium]|nr:hypothetical protein [Candidatus Limnocylindrales bacterium]
MSIGPAIVLAAVLALIHVSIYVLIRGRVGARLPFVLVAAFLGAWAGDAIASRAGLDPVRIGDFHVLAASGLAWAGIAFVAVIAILAPVMSERTGRGPAGTAVGSSAERTAPQSAGDAPR